MQTGLATATKFSEAIDRGLKIRRELKAGDPGEEGKRLRADVFVDVALAESTTRDGTPLDRGLARGLLERIGNTPGLEATVGGAIRVLAKQFVRGRYHQPPLAKHRNFGSIMRGLPEFVGDVVSLGLDRSGIVALAAVSVEKRLPRGTCTGDLQENEAKLKSLRGLLEDAEIDIGESWGSANIKVHDRGASTGKVRVHFRLGDEKVTPDQNPRDTGRAILATLEKHPDLLGELLGNGTNGEGG